VLWKEGGGPRHVFGKRLKKGQSAGKNKKNQPPGASKFWGLKRNQKNGGNHPMPGFGKEHVWGREKGETKSNPGVEKSNGGR